MCEFRHSSKMADSKCKALFKRSNFENSLSVFFLPKPKTIEQMCKEQIEQYIINWKR